VNKKENFVLEIIREASTPLRFRIMEILAKAEKPLSPSEIARDLAKRGYTPTMGSIMGTLSTLVMAGIVKSVTEKETEGSRIRHFYVLTDFGKTLFLLLQEIVNKLAPSK